MSVRMAKSGKDKVSRVQSSQNGKTDAHHTGNKNQPTAEQLRLAQLSNDRAYNSNVDGDTIKKINQITELTGRSQDEALTALYDCDSDLNRAVDKLLEKPAAENEWQEISKKKKTPASKSTTLGGGDQTFTEERGSGGFGFMDSVAGGENDRERNDSVTRGGRKDRDRGAPPRFQQRGGRGRGFGGNFNGGFNDRVGRERGGSGFEGSHGFDGSRGNRRGGENGIGRSRGGGRGGSNAFNGSTHFDTHIDTWTNDSTQNGGESGHAKDKDTAIGAWSDMTEDWTTDEWSGSLEESRVFTPSVSTHSAVTSTFSAGSVKFDSSPAVSAAVSQAAPPTAAVVEQSYSEMTAGLHHGGGTLQQGLYPGSVEQGIGGSAAGDGSSYRSAGSAAVGTPYNVSSTPASQQLYNLTQITPQMPTPVDSYGGTSNQTAYMSQFTKEATECIKNAVGIGSSSSLTPQTLHTANLPQQQQQQQLSNINRTKQLKPRLPPPSKIPSSAVEMPGSMTSAQVDVQFGNWDASPSSGLGLNPSAAESGLSFMSERDSLFHDISAFSKSSSVPVGTVDLPTVQHTPQQQPVLDAQLSASANSGAGVSTAASLLQHINKVEPSVLSGSTFPTQQQQLSQQSLTQQPLPQQQTPPTAEKRSTPVNASTYGQQSSNQQTSAGAGSSVFKPPQQQTATAAQMSGSTGPAHQSVSQAAQYGSYSSYTQSVPGGSEFGLTAGTTNPSNQYSGYNISGYGSGGQSSGFNGNGSAYHGSGFSSNTQQAQNNTSGYGNTQQTANNASGYGNSATSSSSASKLYDMKQSTNTGSYPPGSVSAQFQASVAAAAADRQPQQYIPASAANLYDPAVSAAYQSPVSVASGGSVNQSYQTGSLYGNTGSDSLPLSGSVYESQYNTANQQQLYQKQQQQQRQSSNSSVLGYQQQPGASISSMLGYQQQQQQPAVTGSGVLSYQQTAASVTQTVSASTSSAAFRTSQQPISTAVVSSSVGAAPVSTTVPSQTKLVDGLNKLTLKEGVSAPPGISAVAYDSVTMSNVSSSTTVTNTTLSTSSNISATSSATPTGSSVSKSLSANSTSSSKSSTSFSSNKTMPTMPPGIPQGTVVNQQHNYLVGQPPGFQVAAFGYPTAQQPMTYSYDELQMMQQRMPMPTYFDMPFQTSTTMSSRDTTAAALGSLATQSYADHKLNPMDTLSPVSVQPTQPQQQQAGLSATGSQQPQAGYPVHPAAYSFYYPSAAGLVPYGYQMIPMGSMQAVPSVTNAGHGATTSATQYQKPNNYGSQHSYGQTQDFSKAFGATPAPNKGSIVTPVIGGTTNDMASSGFGKAHMGGFDKAGPLYHGGTPPPFSMALQTGGGQAGASGAGAGGPGASMGMPPGMYPPYMPMTVQPQHQQQNQSQILHHAMPQDNSLSGRGGQAGGLGGQKVSTQVNKMYTGNYWAGN